MEQYEPTYKCPLCGRKLVTKPITADYNALPVMLGKIIDNQQFAGTMLYQVPMHIPCQCPDGSIGLAQFAGFERVK